MKRHYIFASHGTFATGILNSVELILGKQNNIHTLCAYIGDNDDLTEQVNHLMASFPAQDELVVITDIFAGSVNNEFIRFITRPGFHLIAGLNLPLIIEMLIAPQDEALPLLITDSLSNARESIQYCNKTLDAALLADKDF
ncbi:MULTISPECIES: PTS sugar transporter subunit IIA [unclassified Enterobacter]|uniref:PTS sugar transporter subunit IIA n=1 Tax=unclassified Enterobacter TaxID=2608935 RepID=UPI0008E9EE95|nr:MULTISPECIES: PTS sugar transporter subunit IIA [unclassified Enterobacter]SFQ94996.1 PTS system, mannose-specific IIA component [Enterobacter sp. kpr-6]